MLNKAKWLIKESKLRLRYKFMKDCLFCKIINGEVKTDVIADYDDVMAFNDINPVAQTHIVIIPKRHIDSVLTLNQQDGQDLVKMHLLAKDLVEQNGLDGFRLAYNGGKFQHVPHLHMHLLAGPKVEWKKL